MISFDEIQRKAEAEAESDGKGRRSERCDEA